MIGNPAKTCSNPFHRRPVIAVVRMVWLDARFRPELACRTCLRSAINSYVIGHEDGSTHPLEIRPVIS